jgi:hypothetical protein
MVSINSLHTNKLLPPMKSAEVPQQMLLLLLRLKIKNEEFENESESARNGVRLANRPSSLFSEFCSLTLSAAKNP